MLKVETPVTGQGRTDAGVHALGQTAHFDAVPLDTHRFLRSANALLPPSIRLLELNPVPDTFHARFSSTGKVYHYYVSTGSIQLPFDRPYRYHFRGRLDLDAIRAAAPSVVGTHDFTSFSNEAHRGSCSRDPVRTLKRLDLVEEPEGFRLEFEGNGFLYKMCRNLAGTLLAAGRGQITPEGIRQLLAAKDRKLGFTAAPPHALFLIRVDYNASYS